jgi:hypothetical protein
LKSHGIAYRSLPKSSAKLDVIKDHDFNFASTTITQTDNHATISFLIGKLYGLPSSHTGKIDTIHHPDDIIFSYNFLLYIG